MPYKRPESVLVVLHAGSDVLLLQRKDDPEFWQSVTGTMEGDETPIMTAYREVLEETGLSLSSTNRPIVDCHTINQFTIRPQWRYRYAPEVSVNTEHTFITEISKQDQIVLTEHHAHVWLPKHDAIAKAWSPSNQQAIDKFVPEPQT
jgi:dATP pyrophosphohydrolase